MDYAIPSWAIPNRLQRRTRYVVDGLHRLRKEHPGCLDFVLAAVSKELDKKIAYHFYKDLYSLQRNLTGRRFQTLERLMDSGLGLAYRVGRRIISRDRQGELDLHDAEISKYNPKYLDACFQEDIARARALRDYQ